MSWIIFLCVIFCVAASTIYYVAQQTWPYVINAQEMYKVVATKVYNDTTVYFLMSINGKRLVVSVNRDTGKLYRGAYNLFPDSDILQSRVDKRIEKFMSKISVCILNSMDLNIRFKEYENGEDIPEFLKHTKNQKGILKILVDSNPIV
jgi:hypothetical protein